MASSALSRLVIVTRWWRSQTQRTPAGDTASPRFRNSSATRTWPNAGCATAQGNNGVFDVLRYPVLQHRLLAADLLQSQLAAFVIEFLEAVEAVAAVAHHRASLADIAELFGKLQQSYLARMIFCSVVMVS